MEPLKRSLQRLIEREALESISIASAEGSVLLHVNGKTVPQYGRIQSVLFGGSDEIVASYSGLGGQILPQLYSQGEDKAVYSRMGQLMYGIFFVGDMAATEHWRKGKALAREVEEVIAASSELEPYLC